MVRKILEGCPSCGSKLEIGEVHCTVCETRVHARYRPCNFCALTDEQSTFLHLFVTSRGNLSDVEKRLGVSYPTVRAKLDEVIERLTPRDEQWITPPTTMGTPKRRGPVSHTAEPRPFDEAGAGEHSREADVESAGERRAVLEAVERGELDAEEGLRRLHQLGEQHEDED